MVQADDVAVQPVQLGRNHNEDSERCLAEESRGVFVVADGLGGHGKGEVASALAALQPGDAFLLCSDGFWEYVCQEEILAAAVLAVITAGVVLLRKKPAVPNSSVRPSGIYMRLELVRGELAGGQNQQELELLDELMIGADPNCDIVVKSENTAPRHVRLFSVESTVYAEALDTSGETRINGEELQSGTLALDRILICCYPIRISQTGTGRFGISCSVSDVNALFSGAATFCGDIGEYLKQRYRTEL